MRGAQTQEISIPRNPWERAVALLIEGGLPTGSKKKKKKKKKEFPSWHSG